MSLARTIGHARRRGLVLAALALFLVTVAPVSAAGPARTSGGTAPVPTIIGGEPVANGTYPFQAGIIGYRYSNDRGLRPYCGGTLISPFHILTAAHCVDFIGDGEDELPIDELRVTVGRTQVNGHEGFRRRVAAVAAHPNWNPETSRFDVGIVTLAAPVEGVELMKLVTPGTDALQRPGTWFTATGYGNTIQQDVGPGQGGVHYANRLREVQVRLVSQPECTNAYTIDGFSYYDARTISAPGAPVRTRARATVVDRSSWRTRPVAGYRSASPAGDSDALRPVTRASTPGSAT